MRPSIDSFFNELEKLAVKIPVMHGTNGRWTMLRAAAQSRVRGVDPNPQLVYVATAGRARRNATETFAHAAAKAHGGSPVIGEAKIDTAKGWIPHQLTAWGKKEIGTPEDAVDLVSSLDRLPKGAPERGALWQAINKGIGSWKHPERSATLRIRKYTDVKART